LLFFIFFKDKGCSLKDLVESLKGASIRKLTEEEKDNLEGEIGSFEAGEILKKMKNNKSPGSDGFTSEFLKFFCTCNKTSLIIIN
jgi:hypothetical protein